MRARSTTGRSSTVVGSLNVEVGRFMRINRELSDRNVDCTRFDFGIQYMAEIMATTTPIYDCLLQEIKHFMIKYCIIKQECIDTVIDSIKQKVSEQIRLQKNNKIDKLTKDEIMATYVYTAFGNFTTKIRSFFRDSNCEITSNEVYHFYVSIKSAIIG